MVTLGEEWNHLCGAKEEPCLLMKVTGACRGSGSEQEAQHTQQVHVQGPVPSLGRVRGPASHEACPKLLDCRHTA